MPAPIDEAVQSLLDGFVALWFPATAERTPWYADIWVDLSLLTPARAHVTLTTGELITKRAALSVLPGLGAPEVVVQDIARRRYGPARRANPLWLHRRAGLTRRFLRLAIPGVVS